MADDQTTKRQAPPSRPARAVPLSSRQRWIYGGTGGILPTIIDVTGNVSKLSTFADVIAFPIGILIKAALLFFLGGFVARVILAEKEIKLWKAVATGIGAPAVVAQLLTYVPLPLGQDKQQRSQIPTEIALISAARAQEMEVPNVRERIYGLCAPRYGALTLFFRGLLGQYGGEDHTWILVPNRDTGGYAFSSFSKAENAYKDAARNPIVLQVGSDIDSQRPRQDLSIFVTPSNEFIVVLRSELSDEQYRALVKRPQIKVPEADRSVAVRFNEMRRIYSLTWCESDRFPRLPPPPGT